jgi:hypothetical protein
MRRGALVTMREPLVRIRFFDLFQLSVALGKQRATTADETRNVMLAMKALS